MAHERVITTAPATSLARTSMALSTFTRLARQALDAGGRPGGVRGGGAADAALAYLDALAVDCAAAGEVRLRASPWARAILEVASAVMEVVGEHARECAALMNQWRADRPDERIAEVRARLTPRTGTREWCLVLLSACDPVGATTEELQAWVRPQMRPALVRVLASLMHARLVGREGDRWQLRAPGDAEIRRRGLAVDVSV